MQYGNAMYRELGIELLRLVPGTEVAVARLCARCAASMSEINRLHQLVSCDYFLLL